MLAIVWRSLGASILFSLFCQSLDLWAAGISIREQSIRSGGMANAGDGVSTGDAASFFSNPASIGSLPGHSFSLGINIVSAGVEWKDGTSSSPITGLPPYESNASASSENSGGVIPSIFGSHAIGDFRIGWGFSVPAGAVNNYKKDWFGRYYAYETEVSVRSFDLAGAYNINKMITVALGIQYQTGSILLSAAGDLGLLGAQTAGTAMGQHDTIGEFSGDSTGFGGLMGVTVDLKSISIGLSVKGGVRHTAKGKQNYRDQTPEAAQVRVGAIAGGQASLAESDDAEAEIVAPQTTILGMRFEASPKMRAYASINHTKWSSNGQLVIKYNNTERVTALHYKNSLSLSVGGEFDLNKSITLRGGLGIDPSVTEDKYIAARNPDGDRVIIAFGGGYNAGKFSVDAGFSYYSIEDSKVEQSPTTHPSNASRGYFSATGSQSRTLFLLGGSMTI